MRQHVPNGLTLARIILIPVFIIAFYLPWEYANYLAAVIFIAAALTDWFDGYLARRFNVVSPFGAFLDPVADKLLVSTALVLIVAAGPGYLAIPVAIIIGREIAISALREWMAGIGKRKSVSVNTIAKIKTTIQMIAIIMLIICIKHEDTWFNYMAYFFLYLAAILTLWSMFIYSMAAWREIEKNFPESV